MSGDPASVGAPRPRRRRCLLLLLTLLVVWLVCEVGGAIAWSLGTGSVFTFTRAAAARQAVRDGSGVVATTEVPAVAAAQGAVTAAVAPHPFLGFVLDPDKPVGVPVSRWGFVDSSLPLRRRSPDRFVVAIVGGSVALQLAHYAEPELKAALQRSPALAGRSIEIVRLALGGYKQPQQVLAIEWLSTLGAEFDCVVNLDGYNEIALVDENLPQGVPAWYPRSWGRMQDSRPAPDQLLRLGELAVLRRERQERATEAETLWWSPLRQFLWWWSDGRVVTRLGTLRAEIERAAVAPTFAVTGPGTGGQTEVAAREEMVAVWARASRQLHAACKANGMLYCHFLQPNQYVPGQKPIGPDEAKVAIAADDARGKAIAEWYPRLRAEGAVLAAAGVPFTDLTGIFQDHPEPLYVDTCCHLGRDGNRLLAEHVAAGVRAQLDLGGLVVRALAVEPSDVNVTSPFARVRVQVVATDDRGVRHDLGGAGFGVRYAVTPPDLATVAADGTLSPRRRGTGSLRVEFRGVVHAVPVAIGWPDAVVGTDGKAVGGVVPRVEVVRSSASVGPGAALEVRCDDLPAAPFRVVAVGTGPLPDSPVGAELVGVAVFPIVEAGASATIRVPVAADEAGPWFVRVYCLDHGATAVLAASPTFVRS
jgi:hypothetical protein